MSWIAQRLPAALLIVATVVSTSPLYTCAALSPEWVSRWEQDIRFAQEQAREKHPNLFFHESRQEWDGAVDALVDRLPTLDHADVAVELAAIMALVGDGHTRLTMPLGPGIEFMQGHSKTPDATLDELRFHQFPVRFFIDDGGVHILRVDQRHAELVGSKVLKIGSLSTEEAVSAVTPVIRRDNEMQLRYHLPMFLVLPEVLAARGVIEDDTRLRLEVERDNGETATVELEWVPRGETVEWVDARPSGALPMSMQHRDKNFWFSRVDDSRIMYLQFNEVYDSDEESIAAFSDRLAAAIGQEQIEALIVDLRNNRGGDMSLSLPLLHAIQCAEVNEPGHLFTLIGRTTFSAAMMFALELERHTKTLFVGEPTGSTPNHYGDSRKILLPNTGLTLRVSTRYHQNDYTDNRSWIKPHLQASTTMDDYVAGRDPAVELVQSIVADTYHNRPANGRWQGRASFGLNTLDVTVDIDDTGGALEDAEIDFRAELEGLQTSGRAVSFTIHDSRGAPIHFEGTLSSSWMAGVLGSPSRRCPFVLRRLE